MRLFRLYDHHCGTLAGQGAAPGGAPRPRGGTAAMAWDFARFTRAWSAQREAPVARAHIEAAHALVQRRVASLPYRIDRLIAAGLAASALAARGLRIHLVTAGEPGTRYAERWLAPVLQELGLATAALGASAGTDQRAAAHAGAVTLLSARELAMDFLRDAINWPARVDSTQRTVDRLLGTRAKRRDIVLHGLPCAIILDADSALIEHARTPIVLTRQAPALHEAEELKRALELSGQLQEGRDYLRTGESREVVFSTAGQGCIDAWGEQIGGLWNVPHVATQLLAGALVARTVLRRGVHYAIVDGAVAWLVQDRLIPGADFYSRTFLTRMLEALEECPVSSQREEAGRTSYQQVFNRYVHLCGLCHSLSGIESELRRVYGLKRGNRSPRIRPPRFHAAQLVTAQNDKSGPCLAWIAAAAPGACSLVVANSADALSAIAAQLETSAPQWLDDTTDQQLAELLRPGTLLFATARALDEHLAKHLAAGDCPLRVLVLERAASRSVDCRNLFWMHTRLLRGAHRSLLLAADDELFNDRGGVALGRVPVARRARFSLAVLERRIGRIQRIRDRSLRRMRRDLLKHETTMQGLLSFSGRGLYE